MGIKLGNVMAVSKTTLCCGNSRWWLLLSMFNKEAVIQCQFYGRDVHSMATDDRLSASCFLMMVLHLLHLLNSFAACIDSPAQSVSAELGWRTTLKIFTKRGPVFQANIWQWSFWSSQMMFCSGYSSWPVHNFAGGEIRDFSKRYKTSGFMDS